MSKGVNKFIGIGICCAEPEGRQLPGGGTVVNITIACNDSYKDKNTGKVIDKTEFVRVVFFNRLAEIAGEYLRKGSKVYVEGSLRTNKWKDQQGNDRYTTEIVANQMQMLDGRNDQSAPAKNHSATQNQGGTAQKAPPFVPEQAPGGMDDLDMDIPF